MLLSFLLPLSFLFLLIVKENISCSTFIATPYATELRESLLAHSNDGDGDSAGNIIKIPSADWIENSTRTLSNGFQIPQINHTYAYFTEGYAIMNEFQVAIGCYICIYSFKYLYIIIGIKLLLPLI